MPFIDIWMSKGYHFDDAMMHPYFPDINGSYTVESDAAALPDGRRKLIVETASEEPGYGMFAFLKASWDVPCKMEYIAFPKEGGGDGAIVSDYRLWGEWYYMPDTMAGLFPLGTSEAYLSSLMSEYGDHGIRLSDCIALEPRPEFIHRSGLCPTGSVMEDAVKTVRYMNRLMAHETYD